jgi:tight adherence protein B
VVKVLIVAAAGFGLAAGILGLVWVRGSKPHLDESDRLGHRGTTREVERSDTRALSPRWATRALVPAAVGLLCVVVTRWPMAGLLGALASATLPRSLRREVPGTTSRRAEAVAGWTELVRDSLAASAGLSQAIIVTAPSAPLAIRLHVSVLATRLTNGVPLGEALRSFAKEVDDPTAEFLVCALLLAETSRAQKLVEVLSALADSMREDVSMHLRVDASRASARSSVRTVVLFSLAFACTLTVVAHSYLSPFGTATGQLVLGVVGLLYALGLAAMVRLVRPVRTLPLLDGGRT